MTDVATDRLTGKTCTASRGRLIVWNGHACEGANITPPHVDNFILWARCGKADVPAGAAHETDDRSEVTCANCAKII